MIFSVDFSVDNQKWNESYKWVIRSISEILGRLTFSQLKMNLLPKAADEFRSRDYWDQFFDKVGREAFEWFV